MINVTPWTMCHICSESGQCQEQDLPQPLSLLLLCSARRQLRKFPEWKLNQRRPHPSGSRLEAMLLVAVGRLAALRQKRQHAIMGSWR